MNGKYIPIGLSAAVILATVLNTTQVFATPGVWSSSGNNMYYTDGNIGVGNSSPGRMMDVGSSSSATTYLRIHSAANAQAALEFSAAGAQKWAIYKPNNSNNLNMWDGAADRFTFANGGNFGVGLTSPEGKVSVAGGGSAEWLQLHDTLYGTKYKFQNNSNGSSMTLSVLDGTVGTSKHEVFAISRTGRIGIGTDQPKQLLSVNGKILAKEIIVSSAADNWPDYVFEDGYKLMSIPELENYINQNKHLPNIPDANSVATDGVAMGEMQKLQMEKIEELTLYIIQQQKEIDELKSKLDSSLPLADQD